VTETEEILHRLQIKQGNKKKITLYLSEDVYDEFKIACQDVAASRVVEEMMCMFIEDGWNDES